MKKNYVITIKADNRPGLSHLVTGMIEKRLINIDSLSLAVIDIHNIVFITVKICADENTVTTLALKFENIVEVFAVEVAEYNESVCLRAAYFKLSKAFLTTKEFSSLVKYGAVIVNTYQESFLIAKYGSDAAIRNLYNEIDGPHLLGFSQTGLITDSKLIGEDQSSVINRLAA